MKRIYSFLFVTMAMLMLSVSSAWAQYVKVTAPNGTVSWIEIEGTINGTNIEIDRGSNNSAIDQNTKGSIDLNEVWSQSGGSGTHYQVTSIGKGAFSECSGLTSIVIPSSVTSISERAFYMCRRLTSIDIPSSVTSIGNETFSGCSGLTFIEIPSSVTSIAGYAFSDCTDLTSIVVESGNSVYDSRNNCNAIIETASNTLIAGCKNTTIPSSVTSIGTSAFYGCSGLTSIDIPSSVTNIGIFAFSYCSGLTSVVIPSNVTSIRQYAFWECSGLTSITIPSSVTSIGDYAFSFCSNLKDITSGITDVFVTGTHAFDRSENATLYVPKGLVDTYKSTACWNRIRNIEEIIYKIPLTLACNNKGKVLVNGDIEFSNDVDNVDVIDGKENSFEFIPNENCRLEQVIIDGLDVMSSVKDNKLTAKIRENSKMIVTFSKSGSDVNGDGMVNISDVVALVNLILGQ